MKGGGTQVAYFAFFCVFGNPGNFIIWVFAFFCVFFWGFSALWHFLRFFGGIFFALLAMFFAFFFMQFFVDFFLLAQYLQ